MSTGGLIEDYEETAREWAASQGTPARANPLLDHLQAIAKDVRENAAGRALILRLLDDHSAGVRLMAASDALLFAPERAVRVLEQLQQGFGAEAISAEWTLRLHMEGTLNLDLVPPKGPDDKPRP